MKKLNNRGFTLIELLAVIVILALIMVIAFPNIISSMNSSRTSALHSKAKSIVESYQTAYAADQLLPSSSSDRQLAGITGTIGSDWKCISDVTGFADWAELSTTDYKISGTALSGTTAPTTSNVNASTCSSIRQSSAGKIYVLLVGSKNGKFTVRGMVTYAYSDDSNGNVTSVEATS